MDLQDFDPVTKHYTSDELEEICRQIDATSPPLSPFTPAENDPFAAAHATVSAYLTEAFSLAPREQSPQSKGVDLKRTASGKKLLKASPGEAAQLVRAALVQYDHWGRLLEQQSIDSRAKYGVMNWRLMPHSRAVWWNYHHAKLVLDNLVRRKLPFTRDDLVQLLQPPRISTLTNRPNWRGIAEPTLPRILQEYAADHPLDAELCQLISKYAKELAISYGKKNKTLAAELERLAASAMAQPVAESAQNLLPPPQPAPLGDPLILTVVKEWLGLLPQDFQPETVVIGPDQFLLPIDSPLKTEHDQLSLALDVGAFGQTHAGDDASQAAAKLVDRSAESMGKLLLAVAEREVFSRTAQMDLNDISLYMFRRNHFNALTAIGQQRFTVSREDACALLAMVALHHTYTRQTLNDLVVILLRLISAATSKSPLTEGERYALAIYRAATITGPPLGLPSAETQRLTGLIGDSGDFCLVPGEFWADQANADISATAPVQRKNWFALFKHALSATSSRPADKWLKSGEQLIAAIGPDEVRKKMELWLPLIAKGRSFCFMPSSQMDSRSAADTFHDGNATILRGLVWLMLQLPRPAELARLLTNVALAAYKKVPGVGPRAVKVGNAAVFVLSQLNTKDAVGQLALLKVRVKFGTAQKEIEKAFTAAAEALGLPRDEIEEMGLPTYGLEEVGVRRETFGNYRAELLVTGSDAKLTWTDAAGKELKSAPAAVKKDHAEDLKELQQALKDVQGMLPAQRDRIDGMFLLQKSWPIAVWRERFLQHPLVGTIAQRLIWCVDGVPALFVAGEPQDAAGAAIAVGKTAEITMWHPVGRNIAEITAWRRRLEDLAITQPFKQAHREIYLLTAAEENTNTYSNRFAAHIIRQHQFNALCAARGWKNKLRLMVDDSYEPPLKELPQWGLRAEFWVEGVGESYGEDTNESGVYLRLATDQVRFYRTAAATNWVHASGGGYTSRATGPGEQQVNEPLPLSQVPPLVFSEVMRDVDLFVGVASVGNDPTWQDGGPEGRYQTYWQNYSFGDLSGSATTRKEVLERLIPRLKIAQQCSFADRFLIVRGSLRTYKIHLGSGNILMEPNDQYLCIVPKQSAAGGEKQQFFLPFEGDNILSIILSKAFLLADDKKITDSTITRQLKIN